MSKDQREYTRVEASLRVRSTELGLMGTGTDVSMRGVFVQTDKYLPLNAVIRLEIELPEVEEPVPTTCRVVYVRDPRRAKSTGKPAGMGLELLDMPAEMRRRLAELLAENATPSRRGGQPLQALDIVVVDDDPHYRELAAEGFRKRGDRVRVTSDGLEALAMCLEDPPDIVLSDVEMPRMDGWQLLRLMRARPSLANVPVVFLTKLGGDAERLRGYQLGVDAYLPKPYQPEELLVRAHQIVRRAQNSRTSPAARTTLRGELEHVTMPSLLSFLEMDKKTGILLVVGPSVARLTLREGRCIAAEIEGKKGQPPRKVVGTVLDWDSGQFEFAPQEVTGQDQLGAPITKLLLEHARFTDETNKKVGH